MFGPFETEDEAWNYIDKMADEEYRIDIEENCWEAYLTKNKNYGEIILEDVFEDRRDIMEFLIFEIE